MPTKDELLEKAEEAGVEVKASDKKADIEAALEEAGPEGTPSALALEKVGPGPEYVEGEPFDAEAANAHGEAYQEEKRKHRWG